MLFIKYLITLSMIARKVSHENFVGIQKVRSDILNDYTAGKLSNAEKRTLYTASSIIMDRMRKQLSSFHDDGILCPNCQYCGDKFSFPLPNDLVDIDEKNPFIKHYYCCCGDSDLYEKDITGLGIKSCEHFDEL